MFYFTVKSDVAPGVSGGAPVRAVARLPQTVAVGFVMAVTPQISDGNTITLNVRPSITSIVDKVPDPNPDLTIASNIPVIRTREMESILRIDSGNIAVMGGLMEDKLDNADQGVPGFVQNPGFWQPVPESQRHAQQDRTRGIPASGDHQGCEHPG